MKETTSSLNLNQRIQIYIEETVSSLKVPITAAAENNFTFFFFFVQRIKS